MVKLIRGYGGVATYRSFFWYKRIYVGRKFDLLPPDQQRAVIAHELAHIECAHHIIRLIVLPLALLFPPFRRAMCKGQEFEADSIAVQNGHGKALRDYLRGIKFDDSGKYHPSNLARIEKIEHNKLFELFP